MLRGRACAARAHGPEPRGAAKEIIIGSVDVMHRGRVKACQLGGHRSPTLYYRFAFSFLHYLFIFLSFSFSLVSFTSTFLDYNCNPLSPTQHCALCPDVYQLTNYHNVYMHDSVTFNLLYCFGALAVNGSQLYTRSYPMRPNLSGSCNINTHVPRVNSLFSRLATSTAARERVCYAVYALCTCV